MTATSLLSAQNLADSFRFFSKSCHGSSPLYERLSLAVSEDPALLELALNTKNLPIPNIFFAAVHELVLRGFELGLEWLTEEGPLLELSQFRQRQSWKLARCEQHGNWIEWRAFPFA